MRHQVRELNKFFRKIHINPFYFILPIILSFCTAVFEGISAGLLIPLVNGIIRMDFGFLKETVVFKFIHSYFPSILVNNSPIFLVLVGSIFGAIVIKNIFLYLSSLSVVYEVRRFANNMRKSIFSRYIYFGKQFFDINNEGYLHNVLITLTNTIANNLLRLQSSLNNFFMFLVYFALMIFLSWKLTLFVIIIFPVLYYSLQWLINKIKKTSQAYANAQTQISKKIFNILSCIPLVKIYSREKEEEGSFVDISNLIEKYEISIDKKICLIAPVQEVIMSMAVLLLASCIAFIFVKEKSGDISNFIVFFYLLKKSSNMLGSLQSINAYVASSYGPIKEIVKIFNDEEKFFIKDGFKEFTGLKERIEFRDLSFYYNHKVPVLKGVSFSVDKGMTTAIVGPSGTGKTTLTNLVLRLYSTPPHSILIDGTDINDFTIHSLRKHIAIVSQDTLLLNDTIKHNILYGLDVSKITDEALADVLKKSRMYDFVNSMPDGLDTLVGDRGVKLSGGEKQRFSIARALLKGAEILIFDEATSALDVHTERLIQEAIEEMVKAKTTIVIAHRLSTIKKADKIVLIENGQVKEEGTPSELLNAKGLFYKYWNEQAHIRSAI